MLEASFVDMEFALCIARIKMFSDIVLAGFGSLFRACSRSEEANYTCDALFDFLMEQRTSFSRTRCATIRKTALRLANLIRDANALKRYLSPIFSEIQVTVMILELFE